MNKPRLRNLFKSCLVLGLIPGMMILLRVPLRPQNRNPQKAMDRTFDPSPDWRPTHAPVNARYEGNESCSQCHTDGETQAHTPMAQAMEPVAERRLLMKHAQLTFKQGPFSYSITRRGDQSFYTVTDGKTRSACRSSMPSVRARSLRPMFSSATGSFTKGASVFMVELTGWILRWERRRRFRRHLKGL